MEDKKQTELNKEQQEQKARNKKLLIKEEIMGIVGVVVLLGIAFGVPFLPIAEWIQITLLMLGVVAFFVLCAIILRIEQKVGFYECEKCKHRYVPTYFQILISMHIVRTRYMKCPHCGKWSWSKKVLSDKE